MKARRNRQAMNGTLLRGLAVFGILAFAAAGLASCAWSVHQGAMIDAEDYVAEGHYEKALRELDRAKRSDGLSGEDSARIAALEAFCLERLASGTRAVRLVAMPVRNTTQTAAP